MTPASASGAIQGVSAQFQAASLKIAQNVQKKKVKQQFHWLSR